jgi:hypothetical protein
LRNIEVGINAFGIQPNGLAQTGFRLFQLARGKQRTAISQVNSGDIRPQRQSNAVGGQRLVQTAGKVQHLPQVKMHAKGRWRALGCVLQMPDGLSVVAKLRRYGAGELQNDRRMRIDA